MQGNSAMTAPSMRINRRTIGVRTVLLVVISSIAFISVVRFWIAPAAESALTYMVLVGVPVFGIAALSLFPICRPFLVRFQGDAFAAGKSRSVRWAGAVSLSIMILGIIAWCHSYFAYDCLEISPVARLGLALCSDTGIISITFWADPSSGRFPGVRSYSSPTAPRRYDPRGFEFGYWTGNTVLGAGSEVRLGVPHLFVIIVGGTVPLLVVLRTMRRSQRVRSRLCGTCAYDLTGNVSGVCPECGTPVQSDARILAPQDRAEPRWGERV